MKKIIFLLLFTIVLSKIADAQRIKYVYFIFMTYAGYTNSNGEYIAAKHILHAWAFEADATMSEDEIDKYFDTNVMGLVNTESTKFEALLLKCDNGDCATLYKQGCDKGREEDPNCEIYDLKYITIDK